MNNTATSPQKDNKYEVKILYDTLSRADGKVQRMLVPEYFLGGNKPLAIRLQNHDIQIWMWDYSKRVSAKFAVLIDGLEYDFSDEGLFVSNHLGTVFTEDGGALHVVRLMDIYTTTSSKIIMHDDNYTSDEGEVLSPEDKLIEMVKNDSSLGIELVYDGKHASGHRFKWKSNMCSSFRGFGWLESEYKLIPIWFGVNWENREMEITFYREDW